MTTTTARRIVGVIAVTFIAAMLLVMVGAIAVYADNPGPRGPARADHCVNRHEWRAAPYFTTRGELRKAWGAAGFQDRWRPEGRYYPKCGVRLADGYVWVRFNPSSGRSTAMLAQRDFDSPRSAWLYAG